MPTAPQPADDRPGEKHRGPCVIASGNGRDCVARAFELMEAGERPVVAAVQGVKINEDDPNDMSVGYGGLPNEEGVVQLDAAVMDGPLHRAGAVACLERIKNPAMVALEVLRRTDHVLLVGEGALRFARAMGFKEEDLLTEEARQAWLRWKAQLNKDDKWLDRDQQPLGDGERRGDSRTGPEPWRNDIPFTWGTIHCSARDAGGDLGCTTTTSGLSWKLPGRVGDSPLIGCGLYCDNAVGSAGSTGRGEAVIQTLGAYEIVRSMEDGLSPTEACLKACKRIADRTREPRLLDDRGRPNFSVSFYALRKDGAYGGACIWKGGTFAVQDGQGARVLPCEWLFEK
ncbi:MAG: N(4)-(beta-N-acetylglucosaminyl)-L-asparaginase [Phycisphaerales bacterium]|nr:N(4)-(beta-N-acetylglucosaminyl)-L-asparaginase [Phycisphaerales bacterium]